MVIVCSALYELSFKKRIQDVSSAQNWYLKYTISIMGLPQVSHTMLIWKTEIFSEEKTTMKSLFRYLSRNLELLKALYLSPV